MDLHGVENIQFNALGDVDTITVNDLTGTDVTQVNLDLGINGASDGAADTVVINATSGNDAIFVTSNNGVVTITGLAETVTITNFDINDRIVINGLGGDDVISAAGLSAGIQLTADGGDGNDLLVGGHTVSTLRGGLGDDVLIGGTVRDVLDGGPGANVVISGSFPALAASDSSPAAIGSEPTSGMSAALLGQFMASSFVPEGQGAVAVTDPQANPPNLLATPQHA
jgi:Ca2+-binding RTX toxin-like protein